MHKPGPQQTLGPGTLRVHAWHTSCATSASTSNPIAHCVMATPPLGSAMPYSRLDRGVYEGPRHPLSQEASRVRGEIARVLASLRGVEEGKPRSISLTLLEVPHHT
jgi:hypothetical protein